jgi:radical SAM protein (TIGR01212 family)
MEQVVRHYTLLKFYGRPIIKMNRPKFPWGDGRRYNANSKRIKEKYGGRIQKVSINAGFTCPNRDGTKGRGGCIYCNNQSFTPSYCVDVEDITGQIDKGVEFLDKRYKNPLFYAAYFQSYSNTYKPLEELKSIYSSALKHEKISGIVVSTRPDCIDDNILDYFELLSKDYYVSLEYGIESCYDRTLEWINRGHLFEDTKKAIQMTSDRGLEVTGHLLFGLPGESREEMLNQANIVSGLPLNAIKLHHLQIMKNTKLARLYRETPEKFTLFSMEEYIDFVIRFMEKLDPGIAIERLVSEAPPLHRVNPGWGNKRADWVQKKIESVMEEKDTWQGKQFKKSQKFL